MDLDREVRRLDARDDRLDDRLGRLEAMEIRSRLDGIVEDIGELKRGADEDRKQRDIDRREGMKEKKSDRRWQFGASLTAASLVVGAAALLLQAFGGSP